MGYCQGINFITYFLLDISDNNNIWSSFSPSFVSKSLSFKFSSIISYEIQIKNFLQSSIIEKICLVFMTSNSFWINLIVGIL